MDLSRIINMVINAVFRTVVRRGVDAGMNYATGKGKRAADRTPAEDSQAQDAKALAKRGRQAAQISRKL
jgi:hypothetical protein